MKKLVVLGAGESGIGSALLANKMGYEVFVSERHEIVEKDILIKNNIEFEEGGHSSEIILLADEIVKSPGIPDDIYIIREARNRSIPIISEIEFAFRYTEAKIVAITGSNGKTTTTLLIGHILKNARYDVLIAGNIGKGFARSIFERDYNYVVLEISSFQLDDMLNFRPYIAVILNVTPDHLDRYNNDFNKYLSSKLSITNNQKEEDFLIYNFDDKNIKESLNSEARMIPISLHNEFEEYGAFLINQEININTKNNNMKIQTRKWITSSCRRFVTRLKTKWIIIQ